MYLGNRAVAFILLFNMDYDPIQCQCQLSLHSKMKYELTAFCNNNTSANLLKK